MPTHSRKPLLALWDWQSNAACRGLDSDVFFSPPGERGRARRDREATARAICENCAVQPDCAQFARTGGETFGFWGGLSERDRSTNPRRRRRRK